MAKVKLKTRKPTTIAYIEHKGPFDKIPYDDYFAKLYVWAKEKKVRPGFKPLGIFHDDPSKVQPENLRSEIGIPIFGKPESDSEIKVKDMPAMEVASINHKGPSEDYKKTYEALYGWIMQNGFEPSGPAVEVYTRKPKVKGGKTILYSAVQVPVKKAEPSA